MSTPFLSRFTPSLMQPETLEALFVQRHALAERIVELIRESIITPAKHHNLLIGPRGIGKSPDRSEAFCFTFMASSGITRKPRKITYPKLGLA